MRVELCILILDNMSHIRSNLSSEVKDSKKKYDEKSLASKFQAIITKQQEVIQSLSDQILLLKSYITLERANQPFEVNCSDISVNNTSTSSSQTHIRTELEQNINNCNKKYDDFIKLLASTLQITAGETVDQDQLIENIKKLKESSQNKQKQLVFVEKIKQVKVPVVIEKQIEKIVYIERQSQQRVDKPLAKEKYVEKGKQAEYEERNLNKTYSQKNLRNKQEDDRYYDNRDNDRQRYDGYRRNQPGSNLIKKRSDYGRDYYKKRY